MKLIAAVIVLAALFHLLTSGVLPDGYILDFSLAQIFVFPVTLLVLLKARFGGQRVPVLVISIAAVGALLGLTYGYTYALFGSNAILISPFQDDPLEARTRRYRELLNAKLRKEQISTVGRFYQSVSSHHEIAEYIDGDPSVRVMLWGSTGWLQVSILEDAFSNEQPFSSPIWRDFLPQYKLVNYIPAFGLRTDPEPATLRFVTAILGALDVGLTTSIPLPLSQRAVRASLLRSAGQIQSTWTSYAHRSVPWLLLGNQHLREAFRDGKSEIGELSCAIFAYAVAQKYVTERDNPELHAAILNNRAVSQMALKYLKPKGKADVHARAYFRAAMRVSGRGNRFGAASRAPMIAHRNWQNLLLETRGGGKKKQRKKQKKALKKLERKSGKSISKPRKRSKSKRLGKKRRRGKKAQKSL